MTYTPSTGWDEPKPTVEDVGENKPGVFHSRKDCKGIRRPELLRPIDKPCTAARCRECACADQTRRLRPPETPLALTGAVYQMPLDDPVGMAKVAGRILSTSRTLGGHRKDWSCSGF